MPRPMRRMLAALALAAALAGCEGERPVEDAASVTYTEDSRVAYLEAMESYKAKNWEEARLKLQEVRRIFGYSNFARLAELRLADVEFEQGKFPDAIGAYRAFIRAHRSDENVEYARYRIAKASYLEVGDTPLLPPAEERDQGTTEDAFRELKAFDERYPRSRYHVDAHYMLEVATQRLVRHELFVARYYVGEENFDAAVRRIDHALAKYPGSGLDAEALVLKGETLLRKRATADAKVVFEKVVAEYKGPFVVVAQRFLASLGERERSGGG